jgi:GNAT superfamily N-acetyltransferase
MIRDATTDDLPALLALGERMHAESPHFSRGTFNAERLEGTLRHVLSDSRNLLAMAISGGELAGVAVGIVVPHWCSTDVIATDLAIYVETEHRGSMLGASLVKHFKRWGLAAKAAGSVSSVQAGVTTGIHTEQTARLYEAMGARRFGVLMEF